MVGKAVKSKDFIAAEQEQEHEQAAAPNYAWKRDMDEMREAMRQMQEQNILLASQLARSQPPAAHTPVNSPPPAQEEPEEELEQVEFAKAERSIIHEVRAEPPQKVPMKPPGRQPPAPKLPKEEDFLSAERLLFFLAGLFLGLGVSTVVLMVMRL